MSWFNDKMTGLSRGAALAGGAVLLAIGIAGGAGAAKLSHPPIEMAPTVATPIARLAATSGIVTVKGRVAEVFGDRFVLQDGTGRAMVDAGPHVQSNVGVGAVIGAQGRFDDGQLHAAFLIGADGHVEAVGPRGHRPHPGGPDGPDPRGHGPQPEGAADCKAPPPPPAA